MTGAQKRKGDRAELEAAALIQELTGTPTRRLLGAGRMDDRGDLDLYPWVIQVANWNEERMATALRVKPLDADTQALRAYGHQALATRHTGYGVAMLRLWGGGFRFAMTPETWARIHRTLRDLP